jgi:hypothetical protein
MAVIITLPIGMTVASWSLATRENVSGLIWNGQQDNPRGIHIRLDTIRAPAGNSPRHDFQLVSIPL